MATIEKRAGKNGKATYRVKVRLQGHPVLSRSFTRLTDAKLYAASVEADLKRGRAVPGAAAERRTVADMVDRYVTQTLPNKKRNKDRKKVGELLAWWRREIGGYALVNVTAAVITECRDKLLGETTRLAAPRSPATVNRYLAALSAAFKAAVREWFWLEESPMSRVARGPESRGRVRFLSNEERPRLLDECRQSGCRYLYPVVLLALSTGARRGELLSLTWPQVDLSRTLIVLHETKNSDRRVLPLAGPALAAVQELAKVRRLDTVLVFPREDGQAPVDITDAFNSAVERAGIEDFRFHGTRHSAASYLAMNGASLAEIAEVLGHRTLQMVRRYAHLSEAHTAGVVARMNAVIFPAG